MNFSVLLEAGAGAESGGMGGMLGMLLPLVLMLGMIYFLFMRPESKRKKKMEEMLNNLQIADEVVTTGGIIGRVIDVKAESDTVVIETGGDKTRIRVLKSCIAENRTVHE